MVRREQRYLNEDEVETLAAAHPPRHRALIYAAAYLGPRWQEIAGLKHSFLDMRPGRLATIRIVWTIERSNGRYRSVEYGESEAAPGHSRCRRSFGTPRLALGPVAQ